MNIELKNIKFSETLSVDTNAFTADVYVDGKKLLDARNNGMGGSTDYHLYDLTHKEKLKEVEAFCLALPPHKSKWGEMEMNLEFKIDLLLEEWLAAKENARIEKKILKDSLKGICVKTEKGYRLINWTGHTIETMLKSAQGRFVLINAIKKVQREGGEILNKNLDLSLAV
jgi:hypothetical protein